MTPWVIVKIKFSKVWKPRSVMLECQGSRNVNSSSIYYMLRCHCVLGSMVGGGELMRHEIQDSPVLITFTVSRGGVSMMEQEVHGALCRCLGMQ